MFGMILGSYKIDNGPPRDIILDPPSSHVNASIVNYNYFTSEELTMGHHRIVVEGAPLSLTPSNPLPYTFITFLEYLVVKNGTFSSRNVVMMKDSHGQHPSTLRKGLLGGLIPIAVIFVSVLLFMIWRKRGQKKLKREYIDVNTMHRI